jgi:hypothetical protein
VTIGFERAVEHFLDNRGVYIIERDDRGLGHGRAPIGVMPGLVDSYRA